MTAIDGFIIYPTYRVENGKAYVYLFGRLKDKRSFCTRNYFKPFFYIKESDLDKAKKLGTFESEECMVKNFKEEKLVKILKDIPKDIPYLRKSFEQSGIDCFEADVRFAYRFMMENNLKGSLKIKGEESKHEDVRVDVFFDEPELANSEWRPEKDDFKILSLDIETSMDAKKLFCISLYTNDKKLSKVLIVKEKKLKHSESFASEKDLLEKFREYVLEYDPDIITGWNLIDFDFNIIHKKMKQLGIYFDLGRTKDSCSLKIYESFMTDSKADFPGRIVLDGIHMLKTSFIKLSDYKLNTAAKKFTNEEKIIDGENKGEEIENSYKDNPQRLIDYNLLDSKLVIDIIYKSGAMDLTIYRSILTGMPLDRVRASIASLDSLYLRELRVKGYAAPSSSFVERTERTTGGYVMKSKPGIYDYVVVGDFKSLYPSLMITFNIDPLMHRPGCKAIIPGEELIHSPNNTCFSKTKGIIPHILRSLWAEREKARKKKDELARWAIKISMNSIYGVLASPNCRFYSFEMANAITSFAHKMIKTTAKVINEKGYEVIYGDTDSVFVNLNVKSPEEADKLGKEIEKSINIYLSKMIKDEYGIDSFLELEYEKLFKKFLMPKARRSEEGAKKRYAGLLLIKSEQETANKTQNAERKTSFTEKMDFTGLEFVRRDWTAVSKKFQLELLDLIFHEKEISEYVKTFVSDLKDGKYDDLLVYRKALRKDVDEYTKTTPPHVKAARKLSKITSNIIDYVLTVDGPEPIQKIEHSIDYDHYIDKQIKPIADTVLSFFNLDFDDIIRGSEQKNLFNY